MSRDSEYSVMTENQLMLLETLLNFLFDMHRFISHSFVWNFALPKL